MNVTAKQVLKYTLLPGLRPRITQLFFSGFHYIPFFIAIVYQMIRLLPAGHPYANPANIGKFGVRHVIAEAASNLKVDAKNIDQVLLFGLILIGMVIIAVQIVMIGVTVFAQPVLAQVAPMPTSFAGYFVTAKPEQDVAHILLDMVFGVPDIFKSCVSIQGVPCVGFGGNATGGGGPTVTLQTIKWPWPAHQGLHAMLQMYSMGLLIVAVLITSYFIATVLLETAQTGTAFGKRFNKVWVPVRLVVAFGLLVPIGSTGLNSAQYIVLHVAKLGSGFATNGWILFNKTLDTGDAYARGGLLDENNLVSVPNVPEVGGLLQFLFVSRVCAELAEISQAPLYKEMRDKRQPGNKTPLIQPYFIRDPAAVPPSMPLTPGVTNQTYKQMMTFANGAKQVTLVFGYPKADDKKGGINPVCGEMNIPLTDPRPPGKPVKEGGSEKGAEVMQRYYLFVIEEMWFNVFQGSPPQVDTTLGKYQHNYPKTFANLIPTTPEVDQATLPKADSDYGRALQKFYEKDMYSALRDPTETGLDGIVGSEKGAVKEMIESPTWGMETALSDKGWAGAGIWYNRIADLNGAVTGAALSIPTPITYPLLMEEVKKHKRSVDMSAPVEKMFQPEFKDDKPLPANDYGDKKDAEAMWEGFNYWQQIGSTSTHTTEGSNAFVNVVNAIFGTDGLYSMGKNPNIHPLAQLVGLGRGLIEASIRNVGISSGVSLGVGIVTFVTGQPIPLIPSLISFIVSITIVTMTMGFILFYVLPFLPFIYFFFSVGGWIKAIFEAMVGMPLWALAHIRIDKEGLAGQAARNGYFLLFEIFLRPILIVFGLLASISIFAAIVSSLNQTWELIVYNVGGFDTTTNINGEGKNIVGFFRSSIDEFFYTVIYTILVYMMAMSSFKLIDMIPNNILRWMGESVQTFNDMKEDAAESLMGTATIGSQQAFSAIGGSLQKATETMASMHGKSRG